MEISGWTLSISSFCTLLTVHVYMLLLLDIPFNAGSEAVPTPATAAAIPIHLKVVYACDSSATIAWETQDPSNENLSSQKCELTYDLSGSKNVQILDIFLDPHSHNIRLFNLSHGESYTAFIVCDWLKTNEVSFISDSQCDEKKAVSNNSFASSDDNVVPSYSHTSSFSVVEWSIAVTIAVVGVIIAAVVAFYMWKKYQRRQRILRIFRQGQNDPFQALYSPTQDSYSF